LPSYSSSCNSTAFATPRHLERDGITIQAMGLEIPSQHVTPLPPTYRDPWNLEGTSPGLEPDNTTLITNKNRASRRLWLGLKYWEGSPVLSKARLISKPTKRLWLSSRELGAVVRGSHAGEVKGLSRVGEIMAVSTDRGVMEARECVERAIGGQALCRVW